MASRELVSGKDASFKKDFVGELWNGIKVYLVNGDEVRNSGIVSFFGGTHPEYEDCPTPGEIWIERHAAGLEEEAKILLHEIVEYLMMKNLDKSYNDAHDVANSIEAIVRQLNPPAKLVSSPTSPVDSSPSKASQIRARLITIVAKLRRIAYVRQDGSQWFVYSHEGKKLSKGYPSEKQAKERLRQIEYFKHKDAK